ncbi:MAG: hypothetical protein NWQ13_07175, partial [Glaciimonas sp.]|nr:hypothetical protein [Glaciimonas sp.]
MQQNRALLDGSIQLLQQPVQTLSPPNGSYITSGDNAMDQQADAILINHFEIDHNFPEPVAIKIQKLFMQYQGRELSTAQINQVRYQLDAILQADVDFLVFAQLPQQDFSQGVVRFKFTAAKVQAVHVENSSAVSTKTLENFFPSSETKKAKTKKAKTKAQEKTVDVKTVDATNGATETPATDSTDATNTAASTDAVKPAVATAENTTFAMDDSQHPWQDIANTVMRINKLPGVAKVTPQLAPGTEVGSTQLILEVTPAPRVRGSIAMDNAGTTTSGRKRIGGQVVVNNPLGIGDQLQATAFFAPDVLQGKEAKNGHTVIGQAAYDLPLGHQGDRIGVSYARVNYAGGGDFAHVSDGVADTASLHVTHPLMEKGSTSLNLRATLNDKKMTDTLFSATQKRRAQSAQLSLSGTRQGRLKDMTNTLKFSTDITAGSVKIQDPGQFEMSSLAKGKYVKSTSDIQFIQLLGYDLIASAKARAQLSSTRLDASEKMSIGGPNGVRAYNNDLASVDQGVVASLALTKVLPFTPGLSSSVFYDIGRGQIDKNTKNESGTSLSASGFGV